MRNALCLALIITALSGCSGKLDRSTASRLIAQQLNLPKTITAEFQGGELGITAGTNVDQLNSFIGSGLMAAMRTGEGRPLIGPSYDIYRIELTALGRQYYVSETTRTEGWSKPATYFIMKCADQVFGEILGMREIPGANITEVEYTLIYKNLTPFGIAQGWQEGQVTSHTVTFTKYDDGWRIAS